MQITIDDRTIRARKFASQIMGIIQDCVSDKDGAMSRLIDAAYQADIQITAAPKPPAWDAPYNYNYEPVERRAAEIYDGFVYVGPGEKPKWAVRGNSLKQDEARQLARAEMRAAGHSPSVSNGDR